MRVNTSSEFSELLIRSGRIITALSISVDFIVNNTGTTADLNVCLKNGDCILATELNITLGASASVRSGQINIWSGLIQSIYVYEIQVYFRLILGHKIIN